MHEDTLAQVSLFSGLSKRELQTLGAGAVERAYPAGATLIQQGETGVGLFVITEGKVRVFQKHDAGDRELGTFGTNAVLGEMAMLDDVPRSASVIAMEATKALVIPVWDFRGMLRENPDISIKLLAVLGQRLRKMEDSLAD